MHLVRPHNLAGLFLQREINFANYGKCMKLMYESEIWP